MQRRAITLVLSKDKRLHLWLHPVFLSRSSRGVRLIRDSIEDNAYFSQSSGGLRLVWNTRKESR